MPRSGSETIAHRNLKRAALRWAQLHRFTAVAWEVRVPRSPYRADVAAYRLDPALEEESIGQTAVFECKQARGDFLKDRQDLTECLTRFAHLNLRRTRLERQLGVHYPSLRCGDSLFQDFESVDLSRLNHSGYQSVCRELDRTGQAIFGRTKFHRMVKWRCANLFYLVVPRGLAAPEEIPEHWGVLVPPDGADLDDPDAPPLALEVLQRPRLVESPSAIRLELLQRIAGRATSLTNREAAIDPEELFEARRRSVPA